MDTCTFCRIRRGEIPTDFICETDKVLAFGDIHPVADVHILVVPKDHIPRFLDVEGNGLISEMVSVAQNLIKDKGIGGAYKILFNGGRYQDVPHLHMHVLGGKILESEV